MNPLDQLQPPIQPPPVSWWPPAPGWWLLALLLLVVVLALAWHLLWRYRSRAYRRQAVVELARLRLQYPLAGRDIDAVVPAVRIEGHWYLADFVQRAEASLAAEPGATGGKKPSPP